MNEPKHKPPAPVEWPEVGEVVVVKVDRILDYGAFCSLQEYAGLTGFVHISQVATSWIKNIRNFVKENQVRAAQVLKIDLQKNQIDLSFTKVTAGVEHRTLEAFKQSKRAQHLMEVLAREQKKPIETVWREVAEPLMEEYDSLYAALQAIAIEGQSACRGISAEWIPFLVGMARKNIEVSEKSVKTLAKIQVPTPTGILSIKKVLSSLKDFPKTNHEINYLGSGKYALKVVAPDFKTAEKALSALEESIVKGIQKEKGLATVERVAK
ncbi:MAG: S1 RNA-binding domain-containing protein [Candidatus Diapherotrites archaeon]|nr:S1 RNA-binding domain-containing protein [Candidatus Diapherotrites archaeon]